MKKTLLVMVVGLGILRATLPFSLSERLGTCKDNVTNGMYRVLDEMVRPLDYVQQHCEARTTYKSNSKKYSALNAALIYAFIAKDGKAFFDRLKKAISQKTPMFSFECRSLVAEAAMKAFLYSMARPECLIKETKHDLFKTIAYITLAQLVDADFYRKIEDSIKAVYGKGYNAYGFVYDKIVK